MTEKKINELQKSKEIKWRDKVLDNKGGKKIQRKKSNSKIQHKHTFIQKGGQKKQCSKRCK